VSVRFTRVFTAIPQQRHYASYILAELCLLMVCSASFALSLEDVNRELNKSFISEDSLEMKFTTTISSPDINMQTYVNNYLRAPHFFGALFLFYFL